jgi:lysyl-tRNA synthetase class 1
MRTRQRTEVPVTGGHCKLQWKADWAMRWFALGVDYEMSGKDLIPSVELSTKIVRVLGGQPPKALPMSCFWTRGAENLEVQRQWPFGRRMARLRAGRESALFMFQKPRAAKRLYFDAIPRAVDDYLAFRCAISPRGNEPRGALENPVWFIHAAMPPRGLSGQLRAALNLVSASGASDREVLWGFIRSYAPEARPETHPGLDRLVTYALKYYEDFVKPQKRYRAAAVKEREALIGACRRAGKHGRRAQPRNRAERRL